MRFTARGVWEVGSTAAVVITAIWMGTLYLPDRNRARESRASAQEEVEDWLDWSGSGIRLGPENAPMVVAAFIDFECPFCRDLVTVLDSVQREYGQNVAIEFYHFTLPSHRHAVPAAIAAECAHRQGSFDEMYREIFAQMDSLGTKSWAGVAAEAGLPDLEEFEACIQVPWGEFPRIAAGKELGLSVGVGATPTVWINGKLLKRRSLQAFRQRATELGL